MNACKIWIIIIQVNRLLSETIRQVSPVVQMTSPDLMVQIVELLRELPGDKLRDYIKATVKLATPQDKEQQMKK